MSEEKKIVSKEDTFDKLEIRIGRVISVEEEPAAPKKSYKLKIDFGKFGIRTSVGRFAQHSPEEIKGKLVMGILNFPQRQIGDTTSEVLTLEGLAKIMYLIKSPFWCHFSPHLLACPSGHGLVGTAQSSRLALRTDIKIIDFLKYSNFATPSLG